MGTDGRRGRVSKQAPAMGTSGGVSEVRATNAAIDAAAADDVIQRRGAVRRDSTRNTGSIQFRVSSTAP